MQVRRAPMKKKVVAKKVAATPLSMLFAMCDAENDLAYDAEYETPHRTKKRKHTTRASEKTSSHKQTKEPEKTVARERKETKKTKTSKKKVAKTGKKKAPDKKAQISFAQRYQYDECIEGIHTLPDATGVMAATNQRGLVWTRTSWDDNARDVNSSMGPGITDLRLHETITPHKNPMPILRKCNFVDTSMDMPMEKFIVRDEDGTLAPLKTKLQEDGLWCDAFDSKVLTGVQACLFPVLMSDEEASSNMPAVKTLCSLEQDKKNENLGVFEKTHFFPSLYRYHSEHSPRVRCYAIHEFSATVIKSIPEAEQTPIYRHDGSPPSFFPVSGRVGVMCMVQVPLTSDGKRHVGMPLRATIGYYVGTKYGKATMELFNTLADCIDNTYKQEKDAIGSLVVSADQRAKRSTVFVLES